MSHRRVPRPLSAALAGLSERLAPPSTLARVQTVWETVAGDALAGHCAPVAERGGVLRIACDDAVWASEVELMGPELAERLARVLGPGSVTGVRAGADLARGPRIR